MSFFYDFLNFFNVKDVKNEVTISFVLGKGLAVFGFEKIGEISHEIIEVFSKKKNVIISGNDLIVSAVGKGELFVSGKITKVEIGG